ncbi:MAG: Gfo/Idh/MocA family protein [Thermodesulfobacteriota bacterium]
MCVSRPMELIIVGAGMYVCGRGTEGYGTILPAVFEGYRSGLVGTIHIAATSAASARAAREKAKDLGQLMGVSPELRFYPEAGENHHAYLEALKATAGRPRAAMVSVPDHLHFEITRDLIEHDVHVQVVKPLAPTVREVEALVELARQHRVYGAVEYHKRFDEANLKLLALIRQGTLGELLNFRIQYSQRKVIPTTIFRQWVDRTDIFQYLGVHYVDLIHFLTKAQPIRVMSVGMKKYLSREGIDTFDTIQTLIEWQEEGGKTFLSDHLTGWVDPDTSSAMSDQRLEVVGTRGRYISDQKDRGVSLVTDGSSTEQINPYFSQFYPGVDGNTQTFSGYGPRSILQFLRDCSDILNSEVEVDALAGLRATFASSLPVAKVLEASCLSLGGGNRWVTIA